MPVVVDELAIEGLLVMVLAERGYRVLVAINKRQALNRLAEGTRLTTIDFALSI